jgi:hypothetical protein
MWVLFGAGLLLLLAWPILAAPLPQGDCAIMAFSPTIVSDVQVGDVVVLQVLLDADGVTFNTVGFLIHFDETLLQVVDGAGDPATQVELGDLPGANFWNVADNAAGTINFAQFIPDDQIGGTFTVATIRLKVIVPLPGGSTQVEFVGADSGGTGVFDGGVNLLCEGPGPATITTTVCYDFVPPSGVDVADIMLVAVRWGSEVGDGLYDPTYDVDFDGDIDIEDIMLVAIHWGETC